MGFDNARLDDYVDVAERIRQFAVKHPEGCLRPLDPARPFWVETVNDRPFICYAAAAYRTPDDPMPGVGVAWEPFPGTTPYTRNSELMNAETGAWGRAIVAVLAADTKKIATRQDVENRQVVSMSDEQRTIITEALADLTTAAKDEVKAWWKERYPPLASLTETQADEILDYLDSLRKPK